MVGSYDRSRPEPPAPPPATPLTVREWQLITLADLDALADRIDVELARLRAEKAGR